MNKNLDEHYLLIPSPLMVRIAGAFLESTKVMLESEKTLKREIIPPQFRAVTLELGVFLNKACEENMKENPNV